MREKLKELIEPSGKMFREKYVFEHYNEIYLVIKEFIFNYNLNELPFKQQVYHYLNNIKEKRYCKRDGCNTEVKFINSTIGYLEYCCNKCIAIDPTIQKKKENTCLYKYGTKHQSSSKQVKEKKKKTNLERYGHECSIHGEEASIKSKKTLMKNYGVEHPLQNEDILNKLKETTIKKYGVDNVNKLKEVRDKIKETNNDRYGVNAPLQNEEILEKMKNTNIERYGYTCSMLNNEVKEKSKNTILNRYGVEYILQNKNIQEKYKETFTNRYDVEKPLQNKEIHDKMVNTTLERYGVENSFQSEEIKEKIKETNLERYGCENPMQNENIFNKMQHNSLSVKLHHCGLYYQGSYEKDFLDIFSEQAIIEKGKRIKYNNGKIYYCDFYLPEFNILVEIKSSYYYKKYEEKNINKHKECIKLGYEHLFVIDKNYEELKNKIKI